MLKKITVPLRTKSYPIYIQSGCHNQLPEYLRRHRLEGAALIVSQKEVWKKWGSILQSVLKGSGIETAVYMPPGRMKSEQMKNLNVFRNVIKACARLDRKKRGIFLIALGGGVVGDVTGFAASVYKRGVPVVQIPTTLTAQVDSAIGGKTGLDLPEGKNLLGTIYQPAFVLNDPLFLKTLPMDLYRDGLAEVIKYGVIKDQRLFRFLETRHEDILEKKEEVLERIIGQCCQIKAQVVSRDEYDRKGIRAILNFGHTIGHAIEAAAGYETYSHGKAISIGMVAAAELSASLSVLKAKGVIERLSKLLEKYGLPTRLSRKVKAKKIMEALLYDKKRRQGRNRFILLKNIGSTMIYENIPEKLIDERLKKCYEKSPRGSSQSGLLELIFGKRVRKPKRQAMPIPSSQEAIGHVESYLDKIHVAIVNLSQGSVRQGDRIGFQGRSTRFKMTIRSMQINRKSVIAAKSGDVIGLRVPRRVKPGDQVLRF